MPNFSPRQFGTARQIGAKSEIRSLVIRTDETANTVQPRMVAGLRSGQSGSDPVRLDIDLELVSATGGANVDLSFNGVAVAPTSAGVTVAPTAKNIGSGLDVNNFRIVRTRYREVG